MVAGQRADCLEAGIVPALMLSKTVGPSLKLSERM